MENMDKLDNLTPTGGDRTDMVPPPVRVGHNGQPINLSYFEEQILRAGKDGFPGAIPFGIQPFFDIRQQFGYSCHVAAKP